MNIAVVVVKENDTECCSLMECLLIMCDMLLIAIIYSSIALVVLFS